MDAGSAPEWIGPGHLLDEGDGVWSDALAAGFARATLSFPEEAKTLPMPVDDRVGLDESEGRPPSAPRLGKPGPEGSVQASPSGPSGVAGQDQQLMTQGQILQKQLTTRFQKDCGEIEAQESASEACGRRFKKIWFKPSILVPDVIVASDNNSV